MLEYEKILKQFVDTDPRTMVMTAENRAPLRNIAPLLGNKFIDTGITEQTMIGMAAGLALRGKRPIVHALAAFLTMRAFEFIRTDIGIAHLPVKLVGFIPGILSDANGPTHQAIEDIAIMRGIPGMQVFAPADAEDLCLGLPDILRSDAPTYIRWTNLKAAHPHAPFNLGEAECVEFGEEVHLLAYGALYEQAYGAYQLLKKQGIKAGISNLRTLEPVDAKHLAHCARATSLLVTVEDHFLRGGLATILAETLQRERILPPKQLSFGFKTWFKPAALAAVLEYEGLTAAKIAERVKSTLSGE